LFVVTDTASARAAVRRPTLTDRDRASDCDRDRASDRDRDRASDRDRDRDLLVDDRAPVNLGSGPC